MLQNGGGKIINTASMAAVFVPHPQKQIAYNSSKAAVVKITETLGVEWADRNVRVNCISPGIVNTALIQVYCSRAIGVSNKSRCYCELCFSLSASTLHERSCAAKIAKPVQSCYL